MADTYTTNLNLTKPEPGAAEDTWGISLNSDLDTLDAIFSSSGTQVNLNPNQVNFADGKKAIFGTGSDFLLFHDGSNSFIKDEGTGHLNITTNGTDIRLQKNTGEYMAKFIPDGAVELYYDNSKKLETISSGIDVTGVTTTDGFNSLGDTQVINFASDSGYLKITNNVRGGDYRIATSGTTAQRLELKNGNSQKLVRFANNGDISFYDDTGTTQGLFWDASAERLGLGTTSPAAKLDVRAANGNEISLNIGRSDTGSYFKVNHAGNDLRIYNTDGSGQDILFGVDAAGTYQNNKVGIGTSSPSATLEVATSATTNIDVAHFSNSNGAVKAKFHLAASTGDGQLTLYDGNNNADVLISSVGNSYLNSGGNVGIGTTTPNQKLHVNGSAHISGTSPELIINDSDATPTPLIRFRESGTTAAIIKTDSQNLIFTSGGGTERARIDSSGRLLIGQTSSNGDKLEIQGNANVYAARLNGSTTGGQSYGLRVRAGSNSSDAGLLVENTSGTDLFKVRGDGNVGIGLTSPSNPLDVAGIIRSTSTNPQLRIYTSSGTGQGYLIFGDSADDDIGQIVYNHNTDSMRFHTNASERARIDANGNLLVGTTAADIVGSSTATGINLNPNSASSFNRSGGAPLFVNRIGSDGTLLQFRKSGITVGSIGTYSGLLTVGHGDVGLVFSEGGDTILPFNQTANTLRDDAIGLGDATRRFKDLHLSGGAFVGGNLVIDGLLKFEDSGGSDRTVMEYDSNDDLLIKTGTSSGSRSIRFQTEASEVMRIDANARVGIGTTSPNAKLTVQNGIQRINSTDGSSDARIQFSMTDGSNVPTGWVGIPSWNKDALYIFGPTATANESAAFYSNATWVFQTGNTERLRITSTGRLGLNTTNPTTDLEVNASGANGIKITSDQPYLFFNDTDNSGTAYDATISYSGDSLYVGGASAASIIRFRNKASFGESARIDSNGALLVGKTADSFSLAGATLNSGGTAGKVQFVRSGEQPLALNRLTNNGVILGLYQGGTEAGRVGSYAGLLYLGKGDTTLLFDDANDHIVPRGTDGGARDNVINLGSSSNRFNDIYLGGNIILSGTSANEGYIALPDSDLPTSTTHKLYHSNDTLYWNGDSVDTTSTSDYRAKKDIQPLKDGLQRVNKLNPVEFRYIEDDKYSEGFIAHELQEVWEHGVHGEKDGDIMQSVSYGRITPLLVKAIQEQQEQIESLKSEIANLKGE